MPGVRRSAAAIGACAVAAAALRIPFVSAGLVPDEGGYAFVAQQWARGATLYDEAWADRPQGLLIAHRLLLSVADDPAAIRVGALLCGVAITVLLGVIGWQLRGPSSGVAAAAIYAVVGVGPHVTGYTLNGELAAAAPAAAAIAGALRWRSSGRIRWLVAAGLAGGIALVMKQSGFDGLVVAGAVVVTAARGTHRRLMLAALLGAAAVPLAASAIHGWTVGWGNYWSAVAGSRVSGRFDVENLLDRPGRYFETAGYAWLDLGPIVLLALAAIVVARRRRRPIGIPVIWLGAALVGFNLGGLYWRHYYVQLISPLALLAALAIGSFPARRYRAAAVAFAVLPVAAFMAVLVTAAPERRKELIAHQREFEDHERIAAQLEDRLGPDEAIYVLYSEADLYFVVGRPARYPYLWGNALKETPGALDELRTLLASEDRPELIIGYQRPTRLDPSGRLGELIEEHYELDPSLKSNRAQIYRER